MALDAWMAALPPSKRTKKSICQLALPVAHNAAARATLCLPQEVATRHIGAQGCTAAVAAMLGRPIASLVAVCQHDTITVCHH